jgi:hypothetical protein
MKLGAQCRFIGVSRDLFINSGSTGEYFIGTPFIPLTPQDERPEQPEDRFNADRYNERHW